MDSDGQPTPAPVAVRETPEFPETLPVLMLTNQVIFPMSAAPLHLTREQDTRLVDHAAITSKLLALLTRRDAASEDFGLENAYEVGCIGRILQLQHLPDGAMNVAIQAIKRFRVLGVTQREPFMEVRVDPLDDTTSDEKRIAALVDTVRRQMGRLISLSPNIPDGALAVIQNIEDAGFLADLVASSLGLSVGEKQKLLSAVDRNVRLERLTFLLAREVEFLELSHKIQSSVKDSIDDSQREYFLRQQLKAIQDELGEGEESRPEIHEYREKLTALSLPDEARKEAFRELERLAKMSEASSEYHVITTYLDWIVDLPWNKTTKDQLEIAAAERTLNADHYGLERVKRRILEYLAVRKLKPDAAGPILCFVGPPGVGKTSLGQSIARALGRKFVRMSLGGMRDEAEIRGHRKTYVGAMPGRILQSIRKASSNNPVFMLDELDKVGSDFRGDPSSALLEVLDPAQNSTFNDLYLGVAFDLSRVMFIATANVLDTIPWALRDRMEVIEIPGYTIEEKLNIARKYLVPRQLDAHGIPTGKLAFSAAALRGIVSAYTREAGVRNLEREIANVCRGCARAIAEGRRKPIRIGPKDLRSCLGNPRIFREAAQRTILPGVATGMAWTPTGGDILFVEATRMAGKGGLVLTGQLGEVMKESAQAAVSYVRSNAIAIGIEGLDFGAFDIHIHVPAGAVAKDGPSAGVAILAALASLLTGRCVRNGIAMTGEITLRGLVLPVGGVKEKVLAAVRAGIKEIILPARCEQDLDDVPEKARNRLRFHFVNRMEEVLNTALEPRAARAASRPPKRPPTAKPGREGTRPGGNSANRIGRRAERGGRKSAKATQSSRG